MKQLIEDYQRRLDTINQMIENFKSNGSTNDIRKDERLKTKASEYRTFIAELEKTLVDSEQKKPSSIVGDEVDWTVPICRIGYGHKVFVVTAKSEQEAIEKAIDEAGDWEFGEKESDYTAPDGAQKL